MVFRRRWAALAAAGCLALGLSHAALADDELSMSSPKYLAEAAPSRRPLMELLNSAGVADTLEKYNINIYGHVEGSYTYGFDSPANDRLFGRSFDQFHNEVRLNQIDLTVERTVDVTKKQFDIGGRMEWIFGSDAAFTHANGLFDWYDGPDDPENQFDLVQAYLDFAVPVGNGLLIRAGKFVTLFGQEVINPTGNALFSHSYLFNYAIPFTSTGILASYNLNEHWTITGGITRGWDQATEDNNDAIDFLGQVKWTISKETTFTLGTEIGPNLPDNESDYRTVVDAILSHTFNDRLSVALNGDLGWEQDPSGEDWDAYWYGIAGYASYKINNYVTFNSRIEWFRDDGGVRTGFDNANFYELTLGLGIKPFPNDKWGQNLLIRPEIRGDWSDQDVFDNASDDSQYTAAVDVIITF